MTLTIPKTNPPAANSFVNLPVVTDWQDLQAEAVIFGVPHGKPYLADQFPNNQSTAPAALRAASPRILLGGHVRVGLEDNIYLEKGVLAPSNAALVTKAARIIDDLGGSVASVAQARDLLSLSR